jgi:hypothetical protein
MKSEKLTWRNRSIIALATRPRGGFQKERFSTPGLHQRIKNQVRDEVYRHE